MDLWGARPETWLGSLSQQSEFEILEALTKVVTMGRGQWTDLRSTKKLEMTEHGKFLNRRMEEMKVCF
jgi:hypothetical protein